MQHPRFGPGKRRSCTNSLADSIWTGAKHPEEAWEWVKFLGSPECQIIVGKTGAVFPVIQAGVDEVLKLREEQGIDVSAFFEEAAEPGVTFYSPVADNGSEVSTIMQEVEERIYLGDVEDVAAALKEANEEVNASLK